MPITEVEAIPIPISYIIKVTCPNCGGVGSRVVNPAKWYDDDGNPVSPTTEPCGNCGGSGKVVWGEMVVA
jgi:DnaJ-class molecular chaperone